MNLGKPKKCENEEIIEKSKQKYQNLYNNFFAHEIFEFICPLNQKFIKTGWEDLDDLIGGGLAAGHLTEIFGPPGMGKTQICLQILAAFNINYSSKSPAKNALFIGNILFKYRYRK